MSAGSGTSGDGEISAAPAAPVSEEETNADPCTVHEFLARVVTDPRTREAFAKDPAATASAAGFDDLDSDQLGQACRFALDYAPADVVEVYRGSLRSALADDDVGRGASRTANHSTEIAMGHHFGHAGDADKIMAKDSFNLVNAHDVLSHNSVSGPELPPNPAAGAGAATSALSHSTAQVHDAASALPAVGPAANHVLPSGLPTPAQVPQTVSHVVAHGPEQLHATAASLPVAGPVAAHLPEPDAGHVTSLTSSDPAAPVNGATEHAGGGLPIVGEVGHLPLDGLHG